ncbi:MAG TPA: phosphate ABC transporter substrate-binding protein PstS [Candidatus Koribacter sp.]|jgi:phosphate transport system substrate-binding protein
MKSKLSLLVIVAILAIGIACKSSPSSGTSNVVQGNGQGLIGAGSTFVYPLMSRWIADFQGKQQSAPINYQSIGSGGGIQQLKKGLVDFGASDVALTDAQIKEMPAAVVQFPESAGPVCITYNLPGLNQPLRLTGPLLAGIYLGKIKTWRDPALKNANPGVQFPSKPVVVAHRSDGSGTSNIFTTYLSAVSPDWKDKVGIGTAVNWPAGLGGKGSEGVTGIVKQTEGAIGYVELSYAEENKLPTATVENQAHQFVAPSAETASSAITPFADQLANDVRVPVVNAPPSAKDAYPITGLTFLIVPKDGDDASKRAELKKFLDYVVTEGQKPASQLHYAALPDGLVTLDKKLIDSLTAKGQPIQ